MLQYIKYIIFTYYNYTISYIFYNLLKYNLIIKRQDSQGKTCWERCRCYAGCYTERKPEACNSYFVPEYSVREKNFAKKTLRLAWR